MAKGDGMKKVVEYLEELEEKIEEIKLSKEAIEKAKEKLERVKGGDVIRATSNGLRRELRASQNGIFRLEFKHANDRIGVIQIRKARDLRILIASVKRILENLEFYVALAKEIEKENGYSERAIVEKHDDEL